METIVVPTPAQMATAARGDGCTRSDSEAVEATGTRAPAQRAQNRRQEHICFWVF